MTSTKKNRPTRRLSVDVKLTAAEHEWLRSEAAANDHTMADVVRHLIAARMAEDFEERRLGVSAGAVTLEPVTAATLIRPDGSAVAAVDEPAVKHLGWKIARTALIASLCGASDEVKKGKARA